MAPNHLVVLLHGFQGSKDDWNSTLKVIRSHPSSSHVHLLPVSTNAHFRTMDGIANGAQRALKEVLDHVTEISTYEQLSIVGHSMGGIYGRMLVKLLDDAGIFDKLEPYIFASFATPHLGVRRPQRNPFNVTFQSVAGVVSKSTCELAMNDQISENDPLLFKMASPSHLDSLRKFKRRVCYANVFNDFQVPYGTASIRRENPYRKRTSRKHKRTMMKLERKQTPTRPSGVSQLLNGGIELLEKLTPFSILSDSASDNSRQSEGDMSENAVKSEVAPESATLGKTGAPQTNQSKDASKSSAGEPPSSEHKLKKTRPAPLTGSKLYPSLTVWSLAHVHARKYTKELHAYNMDQVVEYAATNSQGTALQRELHSVHPDAKGGLKSAFRHDAMQDKLREMLHNLDELGWERYDAVFSTVFAHEQIIGKNRWLSGIDVIQHFVNEVLFGSQLPQTPDQVSLL